LYHVGIELPSEILTTDFLIVGAAVAALGAAIRSWSFDLRREGK
jgi:hypothetical protein